MTHFADKKASRAMHIFVKVMEVVLIVMEKGFAIMLMVVLVLVIVVWQC